MNGEIKAIETVYNGYRFRSRLEARVAVLFDKISMKYEYEPEGFRLSDGSMYLPDFYLPDEEMYVEVKAIRPNVEKELEKVIEFVKESNALVVIISCIPNPEEAKVWWYPVVWHRSLSDKTLISRIGLMAYENESKNIVSYFIRDFGVTYHPANIGFWNCGYEFVERFSVQKEYVMTPKTDAWMYRNEDLGYEETCAKKDLFFISEAYKSARQARFEYGETPTI